MMARVLKVRPEPGGVWTAAAIATDGVLVRFAADWRPMRDLAEALEQYIIWVELEPWQIIEKLDFSTRTSAE